jgi:hypothetical protein
MRTLRNIPTRILPPVAATLLLGLASVLVAHPARALNNPPIEAFVRITNTTNNTLGGIGTGLNPGTPITGTLSGGGFCDNGSHWVQPPDFAAGQNGQPNQPDGSPPQTLGPGQSIYVESQSNSGGCPSGTGGSVEIPGVGRLSWSVPWLSQNLGLSDCGGFSIPWGAPLSAPGNGWSPGSNFPSAVAQFDTNHDGPWAAGANGWDDCVYQYNIINGTVPEPTNWLAFDQALSRHVAAKNSITNSVGGASYTLRLGDDGNLVVIYNNKTVVWESNTNNAEIALYEDWCPFGAGCANGNLVLLDASGNAIWTSNTHATDGSAVVPAGTNFAGLNVVPAIDAAPPNIPVWSGMSCKGLCGKPPMTPPTGCSFAPTNPPVDTIYTATCDAQQPSDVTELAISDLTFGGMSAPWNDFDGGWAQLNDSGWANKNPNGQPTTSITLPTTNNTYGRPPTVELTVCSVNPWGEACDSPPYSFVYTGYNEGGGVIVCDPTSPGCPKKSGPILNGPTECGGVGAASQTGCGIKPGA